MSFDLAAFDPEAAPKTPDEFRAWYRQQTTWDDDIDYSNPANATPALHDWLRDLMRYFPPLNDPFAELDADQEGSDAPDDDGSSVGHWCDYSAAKAMIYVSFGWPAAEAAFNTSCRLAAEHGVGIFAVSESPSPVLIPDGSGGLIESFEIGYE